MSWHFQERRRGEPYVDPVEQEFFATESLEDVAEALVREAIQNSLDAAAGGTPVEVRFRLGDAGPDAAGYLEGLWPHVRAAFGPRPEERRRPLRVLLVEDFGTRGLEGDPEQDEADDDGGTERNDFFYFWRNVGISKKGEADVGRWGLGKTVFSAASRCSAYFGYTVRRDGRALLMGQAVLKGHRLGDKTYRAYAYYGRQDRGLTVPVEHEQELSAFRRCFGLERTDEPGLSVVVPWPDEEVTAESLLRAALDHYFHPLVTGRLRVRVEDENGRVDLDERNLERAIREHGLDDRLGVVELTRWSLAPDPEAVVTAALPPSDRAPKLHEGLFEDEDLERLRRRFDEGRRVAVRLQLGIAREGRRGRARRTAFLLCMERLPEGGRGEGFFVRRGITIENPKVSRAPGVRWIVVVEDPELSAFLGDAENPAHTEWQRNSPKFRGKYRRGSSCLSFVKKAPAGVLALLTRPTEGPDPHLLREIFSLASAFEEPPARVRPEPSPAGRDRESGADDVPGDLGGDGSLELSRVATGFRLRGRAGEKAPKAFAVRVAYDVLRGNPFSRYSPFDFRMDKTIRVKPRGVRVRSRVANLLELEIEDREFEVLVTRFDPHRDLRVKVEPLPDGREGAS